MDWQELNFDWNRARAFLAVAKEGSFSAAARGLDITQPTVGRRVDALEDELGVTLFERVPSGVELTSTGLALVEYIEDMGNAALRVSRAAAGQSAMLAGTITITASEVISAHILPPIIEQIRDEYPGIDVELEASQRSFDLRRREADIAVRSFKPEDPELVARKIRDDDGYLYGHDGYLEDLGNPTTAEELADAEIISFQDTETLMKRLNALGLELTESNFTVVTDAHLVQWALVKQGVGLGVMLELVGDAEPGVRPALPNLSPVSVPMWLTSHREVRTNRRVRVVFDMLADELES